jgi:NAD(P)H-dependent flavin oxidoreductase YrpB (nitropropane dioxygenase family)
MFLATTDILQSTDLRLLPCPPKRTTTGPELAAAVTNAGGFGVIGGLGYTPKFLRDQIKTIKENLDDKNAPFGVDLLLPQVGGNARKTNTDYTKGALPELIDVIIEEGARLFVCAVGIPPKFAVDKLHAAGIPVMNMIGHPKHVEKALAAGCDIICAQGGEGGGHTGAVPTSILIPKVVELCRGRNSSLTGERVLVVAAGGIYDGRGLASALAMGADGEYSALCDSSMLTCDTVIKRSCDLNYVPLADRSLYMLTNMRPQLFAFILFNHLSIYTGAWVGTRFINATEAGAPPRHQKGVIEAGYDDTIRTLIYTGRPLRVKKTPYIMNWEENRQDDIKALTGKGVVPVYDDMEKLESTGDNQLSGKEMMELHPMLMGQCAAAVNDILPAKQIVDEMVSEAVKLIKGANSTISRL